jgi:signal transduction histidine kinase
MRPAGRYARRPRPGAIGTATLFLLAAGGVLALVGGQTWAAITAQRRLAEKALTDHAATAAWFLEENLGAELSFTVECVFHPLHRVMPEDVHPATPSARLVTGRTLSDLARLRPSPDAECNGRSYARPSWAYRFGPGDEVEVDGSPPPGIRADSVGAVIRRVAPHRRYIRRSEAAVVARLAGRPHLILYSVQRLRNGDGVYAVVLDSAAASPLIDRAVRDCQLLPPPVLPAGEGKRVLRITLGLPDQPLYRSSPDVGSAVTFERAMRPELGGLNVRVDITPEGANMLHLATLPATRVPALIAMLGLSVGLVGLAYRQLRREQELARMRADFVSSVSHELRTPLALQRIFLDMVRLGRTQDEGRFRWAMDNVERESRRLQHLVDTILHFARGERGQLEVAPRRTELGTAVERIAAVYRPLLRPSGSDVCVQRAEEVWADIDEGAFELALANLFQNASKYGPENQHILVLVRAEPPFAIVEVDDQGPGVPAAEREELFLPFRRGDGARRGATGGSGIGLSVVRQVMRLHGGRALLDDAPGGGLRVQLALPLRAGLASPLPGGLPGPVDGA